MLGSFLGADLKVQQAVLPIVIEDMRQAGALPSLRPDPPAHPKVRVQVLSMGAVGVPLLLGLGIRGAAHPLKGGCEGCIAVQPLKLNLRLQLKTK